MTRAVLRSKATLDDRQFNRGITRMGQNVQAFSSGQLASLTGAIGGAFAVTAVQRFAKEQLQAADRTADLVAILGTSAETLQTLDVLTLKYGGTTAQVEKGVLTLKRSLGESIAGMKSYQDAFLRLGIDQSQYVELSKDTDALLDAVARGYRESKDEGTALADVQRLMGRSGSELAGVLDQLGKEGLPETIARMKELGLVIDEEVAMALADANNALEVFGRKATVLSTQEAGGFLIGQGRISGALQSNAALLNPITASTSVLARFLGSRFNPLRRDVEAARGGAAAGGGDLAPGAPGAALKPIRVGNISAADTLARIGGSIGGQSTNAASLLERSLRVQEQQERHLASIDRNIEE